MMLKKENEWISKLIFQWIYLLQLLQRNINRYPRVLSSNTSSYLFFLHFSLRHSIIRLSENQIFISSPSFFYQQQILDHTMTTFLNPLKPQSNLPTTRFISTLSTHEKTTRKMNTCSATVDFSTNSKTTRVKFLSFSFFFSHTRFFFFASQSLSQSALWDYKHIVTQSNINLQHMQSREIICNNNTPARVK